VPDRSNSRAEYSGRALAGRAARSGSHDARRPTGAKAYERVAPPRLPVHSGTPKVPGRARVTVADVDPKNTPRGKRVLASSARFVCLSETSEGQQFGHRMRAGKKVFGKRILRWALASCVLDGVHAQTLMTDIPAMRSPLLRSQC